MGRRKASDAAGVVAEMLKDGGDKMVSILTEVFNDVLQTKKTPPSAWKEARIKVLFKKGDEKLLENYRPITILPILYKVFSRVLDARLKRLLDKQQSVDQAGFRGGFSCLP